MPRTLDQVVREQLGGLTMQVAAQQLEIERLTEENQKLQKDLDDFLKAGEQKQKEPA